MTDQHDAVFQIRVTCPSEGEAESFSNKEELLCNLEEFDSNDPAWFKAEVVDALGRDLVLVVKIWTDQCDVRLK